MRAIIAELIPANCLTLVPLRVEHAGEMAAVLSDPDLYTFTGGSPPTVQELRTRYERWIVGSPDPAEFWCNWVIQLHSRQCLAGTVQATISDLGDQPVAEVAWIVGTRWQGQGIATEAARALIAWLHRQSIHAVIAHIHPCNQASAAVAAAAGLAPTDHSQDGEIRWHLTISGSKLLPNDSAVPKAVVERARPTTATVQHSRPDNSNMHSAVVASSRRTTSTAQTLRSLQNRASFSRPPCGR